MLLQTFRRWFEKKVWRVVWTWLRKGGLACARERAACIPARASRQGVVEVMLCESVKQPGTFVFPGGGIDAGESAEVAALRELFEEAGVSGHGLSRLGEFYDSKSSTRSSIFLVTVDKQHESWPESHLGRNRRWFTIAELDRNLSTKKLQRHTRELLLAQQLTANDLK
jgi:8-oxo-dGTP pyrophosphatase MutT (NUDIX family)